MAWLTAAALGMLAVLPVWEGAMRNELASMRRPYTSLQASALLAMLALLVGLGM